MRLALLTKATRQQMSLQAGVRQEELMTSFYFRHEGWDQIWHRSIISVWVYFRNNEMLTGQ